MNHFEILNSAGTVVATLQSDTVETEFIQSDQTGSNFEAVWIFRRAGECIATIRVNSIMGWVKLEEPK